MLRAAPSRNPKPQREPLSRTPERSAGCPSAEALGSDHTMSFNKAYYGSRRPSGARMFFVNVTFIVIATTFFGWWADFVPSERWSRHGTIAALSVSIIIMITIAHADISGKQVLRHGVTLRHRVFFYLFVPVMVFGFMWASLVHGFGSISNHFTGRMESFEIAVAKRAYHSRGSCYYKLTSSYFRDSTPGHLCISEYEFRSMPDTGSVVLRGRRSPFGFSVTSWEVENSDEPLQPADSVGW